MTTGNDFYEEDEPLQAVVAAFRAAEKGLTSPHLPPGASFVTAARTFGGGTIGRFSSGFLGLQVTKTAV